MTVRILHSIPVVINHWLTGSHYDLTFTRSRPYIYHPVYFNHIYTLTYINTMW